MLRGSNARFVIGQGTNDILIKDEESLRGDEIIKMIKIIRWVGVAFLIFVLVIGLLGCSGGQGYSSTATGNIEGTVTDETDVAIAGAVVVLEEADLSAITDADGYYRLKDIPVGTYNVAASADEYYPQTAAVTVEEDKTVARHVTLQAIQIYTAYAVSGTVTDKDTKGPLGGATVTIEGTGWSSTTEDDGSYSLSDVEAGTYGITASKLGYISQTETVTAESDTTVDFELISLVHYDLVIDSTAGVLVTTPGEGTFVYDAGTVVELVAEADDGYRFVGWTGDVGTIDDVNAAATNITMNGNYSITANSVAVYDLAVSSTEGGSVTAPGGGTSTYHAGTVVELMAEADDGYRFVEWTGDVGTIADVGVAITTIIISGNYSITASFAMEATPVRVGSITYETDGGPNKNKHLNITVLLLDELGEPVVGASVSATLCRDDGGSWNFQGTTDLYGTVTFRVTNHGSGCYWTVVTNVQAEGLEWDGATPENGYCKE
jgi:hypothetical protein